MMNWSSAERGGKPHRKQFEAHQAQFRHRSAQFLGRFLGPFERQHSDTMDPSRERVVFFGKVVVRRAAGCDAEFGFPELWNIAGTRREQHRLLDVVLVHNFEPELDLLRRAHITVVARIPESLEKVGVEGLIRWPETRIASVPRRLEIFADVALPFQHMSIGINYRGPFSHVLPSFYFVEQ